MKQLCATFVAFTILIWQIVLIVNLQAMTNIFVLLEEVYGRYYSGVSPTSQIEITTAKGNV